MLSVHFTIERVNHHCLLAQSSENHMYTIFKKKKKLLCRYIYTRVYLYVRVRQANSLLNH